MKTEDLENILGNAPVLVAVPDSKAQEHVEEFLQHPGLPIIFGLMLGSRQAQYAALAIAPLENMGTVARAAVIQGTIKGIELFKHTLLEQTVPSQDKQEQ